MFKFHKFLGVVMVVCLLLAAVPLALAQENTENKVIAVTLGDFNISMPSSLLAGTVAFEVTNNGDVEHNFKIEGQGLEESFETNLQPGESGMLEVNLEPGTYQVYSPAGDDVNQGMTLEVTVMEAEGDDTMTDAGAEETAEGQAAETAAEAAAAETPAPETPATLPQTGELNFPWTEMRLVGAGIVFVIGGLGLALIVRRKS